ncbi:MAG: zinc metalloprotease HtpX [Peptococcaceae bacterium]|jgi:heat shock protein HtpX|nr:zinc metalloprotease HtpX [Peptococcaceae bacterium]
MNNFKAFLLLTALSVILVLIGNYVGGVNGALGFLLISLAMNFFSYYYSDRMAIAMTGSREVSEAQAPELHAIVRDLTARAGLPMPMVYISPSPQPNAFATGRNPAHAAVSVTQGALRLLSYRELEGVLAHEISHIKDHDILVASIAAALAGAITWIATILQWGVMLGGFGQGGGRRNNEGGLGLLVMAILAPVAALLVQLAISRSREYQADAAGARLAGPLGLADALEKLEHAAGRIPMQVNPAASHLFIVNPLAGRSLVAGLFSTHPPLPERVRRLRAMRV